MIGTLFLADSMGLNVGAICGFTIAGTITFLGLCWASSKLDEWRKKRNGNRTGN